MKNLFLCALTLHLYFSYFRDFYIEYGFLGVWRCIDGSKWRYPLLVQLLCMYRAWRRDCNTLGLYLMFSQYICKNYIHSSIDCWFCIEIKYTHSYKYIVPYFFNINTITVISAFVAIYGTPCISRATKKGDRALHQEQGRKKLHKMYHFFVSFWSSSLYNYSL